MTGSGGIQIVAELGLSHMGKLELAKRLVEETRSADYIKIQVYKTEELINKARDPERFARFKERELSYEEVAKLKEFCGDKFLATPHTVGAFEFLKGLGVGCYKVGSGDRGEILNRVLDTGKEVFVSTGMRSESDVRMLVEQYGCQRVTFLHCVTMYPVLEENADLGFLESLKRWCSLTGSGFGYSDHLPGTIGCEIAASQGVDVIEKHVRLPESIGQDNSCALTGSEFRQMVKKVRRIEYLRGNGLRNYSGKERENELWALKGRDGLRPYSR